MTRTRSALVLVLSALLLVGVAACGDDGDDTTDETTTSEAAGADATDPVDAPATDPTDDADTTSTEADPTPTDPDVTTTSPNLAPNDSALAELLLAPSEVGAGYAPDDTLGDGSFDGDVCEEVSVESTADDEASQALASGTGAEAVSFTQSVMRFADAAAAEEFVGAVVDGIAQCTPAVVVEEVDGVGDQATILSDDDGQIVVVAALVRVGDLVSWIGSAAVTGSDVAIDEDLVGQIGEQLAA